MDAGERFDLKEAPRIRRELLKFIKQGAHVTVSLDRVTYLDTAGVAVMVEVARRASELGACVTLGEVSEAANAALEIARLDRFFPSAREVD